MSIVSKGNRAETYSLTIVFASILLITAGTSNQAFAHGPPPGACGNEYHGTIVTAKINNGTQTFDGGNFNADKQTGFKIWYVIKVTGGSNKGNVLPGNIWLQYQNPTYRMGSCTGTVYPSQDLTLSWSYAYAGGYNPANRGLCTTVNCVYWTVTWVDSSPNLNASKNIIPSSPGNLSVWAISSSQLVLGWNAPVNSAITGYKIERSADGGITWSTKSENTNSTVTTYTDSDLESHTTYYYRVSTVSQIVTSIPSEMSHGTTFYPVLTVVAQDTNGNSITGFNATFSQNGNKVATGLMPIPFWLTDSGNYELKAYDGQYAFDHWEDTGSTDADRTISITSDAQATAVYKKILYPPINLIATVRSSAQIDLSWTAPSDNGTSPLIGYKIERSTDNGSTWAMLIPNTDSMSTTYSDNGLDSNTTYSYRVSAINSAGTSLPSNTVSATTLAILSVTSVDVAGNPLDGIWMELHSPDGTTLAEGYSPISFDVLQGTQYTVYANNYMQHIFVHWDDGSMNPSRDFAITEDAAFTATYTITTTDQFLQPLQ